MKKRTKFLVTGGLIAAIYAATTYVAAAFNLAYLGVQFRFSEALTILPVFTPAAIPGLIIGCFLANLGSSMALDVIIGTAATTLAAFCSYYTRKITFKGLPLLSLIFPVIINAVFIGAEIAFCFLPQGATLDGFLISALQVGTGQLAVCYGLGLPLYTILNKYKTKIF